MNPNGEVITTNAGKDSGDGIDKPVIMAIYCAQGQEKGNHHKDITHIFCMPQGSNGKNQSNGNMRRGESSSQMRAGAIDKDHDMGEQPSSVGLSNLHRFRKVAGSDHGDDREDEIAHVKGKSKIEDQLFEGFGLLEIQIQRQAPDHGIVTEIGKMKELAGEPMVEFDPPVQGRIVSENLVVYPHKKGIQPIMKDDLVHAVTGDEEVAKQRYRIQAPDKAQDSVGFTAGLQGSVPPGHQEHDHDYTQVSGEVPVCVFGVGYAQAHIEQDPAAIDQSNDVYSGEKLRFSG